MLPAHAVRPFTHWFDLPAMQSRRSTTARIGITRRKRGRQGWRRRRRRWRAGYRRPATQPRQFTVFPMLDHAAPAAGRTASTTIPTGEFVWTAEQTGSVGIAARRSGRPAQGLVLAALPKAWPTYRRPGSAPARFRPVPDEKPTGTPGGFTAAGCAVESVSSMPERHAFQLVAESRGTRCSPRPVYAVSAMLIGQ